MCVEKARVQYTELGIDVPYEPFLVAPFMSIDFAGDRIRPGQVLDHDPELPDADEAFERIHDRVTVPWIGLHQRRFDSFRVLPNEC